MSSPGALNHIRVLDLTHHIAGPYCTKLLADYGAEVIKVERPGGGDPCRRLGPFPGDNPDQEKGGLFLFLNTNKRGITLNLKTAAGKEIFKRLLEDTDVLVENFHPRVMPSLGLDFETLETARPGLVMISISNFGQTGPYRDYKAADIVEQALGGLMYQTGLNARQPLKVGLSQAQFWAGIMGAAATLTGVFGAEASGQGEHVDVSIMECVASGLQGALGLYSFTGMVRWRQQREEAGTNHILPCKDGYVIPMVPAYTDWDVFANCLEAPELLDPRFATAEDRTRHMPEVVSMVRERLKHRGRHELFHRGQEWGMPFGMVQEPKDLLECPQLTARDFWAKIGHPIAGEQVYPGAPFKLSASPWEARSPAPTLGQHNVDIYGSLGYSKEDVRMLRESGVI